MVTSVLVANVGQLTLLGALCLTVLNPALPLLGPTPQPNVLPSMTGIGS